MITTLIKQPLETLTHRFVLGGGVVITGLVFSAAVSRGLVPGSVALGLVAQLASGAIEAELTGGTDGERYLVTVRGSDAGGDVHEGELEIALVDGSWTMPDGGVAYLTITEFVDRFGLEETVRMTDAAGDGRIDRQLLISALRDAQGSADVNLAARYAVPIATVPDAIKTAIADIARSRLYPRGAPLGVADAAKAANRLLERIAEGKLPLPLPAGVTAPAATTDAPVLVSATGTGRAYPDGLADY